MIRTENFLITDGPEAHLFPNAIIKYDSFFLIQSNPRKLTEQLKHYTASDLGGKGAKFLISENLNCKVTTIRGIDRHFPCEADHNELFQVLTDPSTHLNFNARIAHPAFAAIIRRDEMLETLLSSFPWMNHVHLYFIAGHYILRLIDTDFRIMYSLSEYERPFDLSPGAKALFVEREIYESDFSKISNTLIPLYKSHPELLTDVAFEFEQTKGII